ncbi:SMP-30/gluconolactonase/LRE family protein [Streptomyces sp. NPDC001732]
MTPEIVIPGRAAVGEGPVWDAAAGRLHWVDIPAGHIHSSDPVTGRTARLELPTSVGAAVPRHGGGFVAATAEGFATVHSDGSMTMRRAILPFGERMNDAKCDRRGWFWAGSTTLDFQPGKGALHVLLPDWTTRVVLEGMTLPNGLDWSPDGRTFYLADSMTGEICAFDTDSAEPRISRRRVLIRIPAKAGLPDGLTVDTTGCLWVALWGGDSVVRISPEGDVLQQIPMPVHQPSSCAFGGPSLDALYVTSARDGLEVAPDAPDGSVFAVRQPGAAGLSPTWFAG